MGIDEIRLECLRIAASADGDTLAVAREYADFVSPCIPKEAYPPCGANSPPDGTVRRSE